MHMQQVPFYDKLVAGFIGRDYKKLNQLVYYLYITNSEYPTTYYELRRYDMQQIFIVKESVMEFIIIKFFVKQRWARGTILCKPIIRGSFWGGMGLGSTSKARGNCNSGW